MTSNPCGQWWSVRSPFTKCYALYRLLTVAVMYISWQDYQLWQPEGCEWRIPELSSQNQSSIEQVFSTSFKFFKVGNNSSVWMGSEFSDEILNGQVQEMEWVSGGLTWLYLFYLISFYKRMCISTFCWMHFVNNPQTSTIFHVWSNLFWLLIFATVWPGYNLLWWYLDLTPGRPPTLIRFSLQRSLTSGDSAMWWWPFLTPVIFLRRPRLSCTPGLCL